MLKVEWKLESLRGSDVAHDSFNLVGGTVSFSCQVHRDIRVCSDIPPTPINDITISKVACMDPQAHCQHEHVMKLVVQLVVVQGCCRAGMLRERWDGTNAKSFSTLGLTS